MAHKKDDRVRNWTFIGYPGDSLPEDYAKQLNRMGLKWIESPVHSPDPEEGQLKNHIHFALIFDGKKSYEQVKEITDSLRSSFPEKIKSLPGMVKYFAHLTTPEKEQFPDGWKSIKGHGGANVKKYIEEDEEKHTSIKEIVTFCEDNNITEFCDLMQAAIVTEDDDWLEAVCKTYTMAIHFYLQSRRQKAKNHILLKEGEGNATCISHG